MFDNPDDTARFFYYALFGLVLIASLLFSQRQRLSQTLQQAAIWGLIFLFTVVAYGLKDDISAQLFPRAAMVNDQGEIVLSRAGDGHFYATLEVNGVDVEFVVDTGATDVVLSQEDAARIGLDPDNLRYTGRAMTANGLVETAPVRLETVALGGYEDRGVRASVNGGALSGSLLGMTYLERFDRVEISRGRMVLVR